MKMHGPVTTKIQVLVTDGDRIAEVGYDMPAGTFPTTPEMEKAISECLVGVQEQLGAEWRLATKQEYQNHVISERFGVDADFAVAGSDKWDKP